MGCVVSAWKSRWYPGRIDRVNADGTYAVAFDDGDYEPCQPPAWLRLPQDGRLYGTHGQEVEANALGEDIPGAFFVVGAAIPQANGLYARDGTYSGAPLFKNGQLWLLRYTIGTTRYWYIADKDQLDRDDGDLYRVRASGNVPPSTGWTVARDGVEPAPSLQPIVDQDGPAGFFVQGAGVSACNGAYQRDGSYSSAPLYKQRDGEYWLLRYVIGTRRFWYVAHKEGKR